MVDELERQAAFYKERWTSAICLLEEGNPNHDRDVECISSAERARRNTEAMTLAWEQSATINPAQGVY